MTRNILQNTQFQTSNTHSTTIRTNPHNNATYTQLFPYTSIIPIFKTVPLSTIPQSTVLNANYINSSLSFSEPIKPFDGLDHNYTPEETLQHIEARVTFSLGLQPMSEHEYEFWHARRMVFLMILNWHSS